MSQTLYPRLCRHRQSRRQLIAKAEARALRLSTEVGEIITEAWDEIAPINLTALCPRGRIISAKEPCE